MGKNHDLWLMTYFHKLIWKWLALNKYYAISNRNINAVFLNDIENGKLSSGSGKVTFYDSLFTCRSLLSFEA